MKVIAKYNLCRGRAPDLVRVRRLRFEAEGQVRSVFPDRGLATDDMAAVAWMDALVESHGGEIAEMRSDRLSVTVRGSAPEGCARYATEWGLDSDLPTLHGCEEEIEVPDSPAGHDRERDDGTQGPLRGE